jgi:hypothetical protein
MQRQVSTLVGEEVMEGGLDVCIGAVCTSTAGRHAVESFNSALEECLLAFEEAVFPRIDVSDHGRTVKSGAVTRKAGLHKNFLSAALLLLR